MLERSSDAGYAFGDGRIVSVLLPTATRLSRALVGGFGGEQIALVRSVSSRLTGDWEL